MLVALVALVPLAFASPPDQTWIGGFYDDADFDDVVLILTSAVGSLQCTVVPQIHPLPAVGEIACFERRQLVTDELRRCLTTRAPPIA